jgi:hypothetical protein
MLIRSTAFPRFDQARDKLATEHLHRTFYIPGFPKRKFYPNFRLRWLRHFRFDTIHGLQDAASTSRPYAIFVVVHSNGSILERAEESAVNVFVDGALWKVVSFVDIGDEKLA